MSRITVKACRTFLIACIIAGIAIPYRPVQAAIANEVNRPIAANDDLRVTIEKPPKTLHYKNSSYVMQFENRADHEVTYTDLQVFFPDLLKQPRVLSSSETLAYAGAAKDEIKAGSVEASKGTTFFPTHIPSPGSTAGDCKTGCVILMVVFVVLIVGFIVIAIKEANKKSHSRAQDAAQVLSTLDEKPLQLLRYRSESRQFIIDNQSPYELGRIEIRMKDNYGRSRVFRTQDARPST